ncbi:MAG: small ribosomal subunit Rsm22 family protein [Treponema sp.]
MDKKPFYATFIEKPQRIKKTSSRKEEKPLPEKPKKAKTLKRTPNKKIEIQKKTLFNKLTKDEYNIINSFLQFVDPVLMLNKKQKAQTYKNIKSLFHQLTDERSNRSYDYLNNPVNLSSYIYYYLWWNLYRLVILFSSLQFELKDNSFVADFGTGPLTSILALWIAKPELREKEITFYCIDISAKVMNLGEEIFYSLAKFTSKEKVKWKIKKVQGSFGIPLQNKLSLFISCNMFNELLWNEQHHLKNEIRNYAKTINSYLEEDGSCLIVEPGFPIGGAIISSFRQCFLEKGYNVESPCPHTAYCPLHEKSIGGNNPIAKNKWCHFAFSTSKAPSNLLHLSDSVGLNKKIASLSYIYCSKMKQKEKEDSLFFSCIITSNIIKLSNNKIGRYACSSKGFLLLEGDEDSIVKELHFGSLIKLSNSFFNISFRDPKSKAVIIRL